MRTEPVLITFLFRFSLELWNVSQRHCGCKLERVWLAHVACCCIILFSCSDHIKYASNMAHALILRECVSEEIIVML